MFLELIKQLKHLSISFKATLERHIYIHEEKGHRPEVAFFLFGRAFMILIKEAFEIIDNFVPVFAEEDSI